MKCLKKEKMASRNEEAMRVKNGQADLKNNQMELLQIENIVVEILKITVYMLNNTSDTSEERAF